MAPANGCRAGTAVVAVNRVAGASYAWSIEGGDFVDGVGTDRVTIAFGGGDSAKISVAVSTATCTSTGSAVIALHDAFTITSLSAGAGLLGQPRTITWDYANGTPASQTLSGTDFGPVTLPNDARSYSYTPTSEGDKYVVMQARSGGTPSTGRTHAAGRGTAAASDCNVAAAKAVYHVNCNTPDATIYAPASSGLDTPFTARVHLDSFSTASWKIANGTPSTATGESVTIKPTGTVPVEISVTVSAGACSATSSARVTLEAACDNPTAEVGLIAKADCSTVVQAHFTGRPPFRGTWNDGTPFLTSTYTADRTVLAAGNYSIAHFQDSLCAGGASNSVAASPARVSAVLSAPYGTWASGSQVSAVLTGTPPFNGTWWDGQTFTTSSHQIARSITTGGTVSMTVSDSTCGPVASNQLEFRDPGSVTLSLDPRTAAACQPIGTGVIVYATITNGVPPYTLIWSDGFSQTLPVNASPQVTRTVTLPASGLSLGITTAHDAGCNLTVGSPPIVVNASQSALFSISGAICTGQAVTATLYNTPVAGSGIAWSVANGSIVSGQGTASITFIPGSGPMTVSSSVVSPKGCTTSSGVSITPWTSQAAPQPLVTQGSTVSVGTPVTVAWFVDRNFNYATIDASTAGNPPTPPQCSSTLCSSSYTPKAAGKVTFTVKLYGRCGDVASGTTTLTVQ